MFCQQDTTLSNDTSTGLAHDPVLLDLFSTSHTFPEKCSKNAPYLCIPPEDGKPGRLFQLCCNDWTCPRCGQMRARYEYGRIVEGARLLVDQGHSLYFVTLTCPGDQALADAEATYLENTNRLLNAFRVLVKRAGGYWCYASVTERQKRGHPHSHYLTTACPKDAFAILDDYPGYCASVARINERIPHQARFTAIPEADVSLLDLHSEWLMLAAQRAGLGVQARISAVDLVEGASRYIAKYLFKACMGETWPKGWKRIRYSRNWPKLPDQANENAFPLLTAYDWHRAKMLGGELVCLWPETYEKALSMGCENAILGEKGEK